MTCIYCGGGDFSRMCEVSDHLRVVPGTFAFFACRDCGSWQLNPLPSASDLASYYPAVYTYKPPDDKGIRGLATRLETAVYYEPVLRYNVAAIQRYCAGAGRSLLDLGCGNGLQLHSFRSAGYRVAGLDMDEHAVAFARDRLGLDVRQGLIGEGRPFPRESFSVVIMFHVLEHVLNPKEVVSWAASFLEPGGFLAIMVPNPASIHWRVLRSRWAELRDAPRHVALPSAGGTKAALDAARLRLMATVPGAPAVQAATVSVSLFPVASFARSRGGLIHTLATRALGGAVYGLCLPAALVARATAFASNVIYFAQKPSCSNDT